MTPLTYMSRGELDPKFVKGYSDQQVADWKAAWVVQKNVETVWEQLWQRFVVSPEFVPAPDEWMTGDEFVATLDDPSYIIATRKRAHVVEVKLAISRFLNRIHKHVWCPQMMNEMKCLSNTYEMKFGISLA